MVAIKQHLQADREKLTKIRALLVRQKIHLSFLSSTYFKIKGNYLVV